MFFLFVSIKFPGFYKLGVWILRKLLFHDNRILKNIQDKTISILPIFTDEKLSDLEKGIEINIK